MLGLFGPLSEITSISILFEEISVSHLKKKLGISKKKKLDKKSLLKFHAMFH